VSTSPAEQFRDVVLAERGGEHRHATRRAGRKVAFDDKVKVARGAKESVVNDDGGKVTRGRLGTLENVEHARE